MDSLQDFPVAKPTKANAKGEKLERLNPRVLGKAKFTTCASIEGIQASTLKARLMTKTLFGHRVGALIARIFRPITRLFCWWQSYKLSDGATIFLMPDSIAIFFAFLLLLTPFPILFSIDFRLVVAGVLISPFFFLTILRIKNGQALCVKLLLIFPYWFVRIPTGSEFDVYEAWEDPAPTGVAFMLSHDAGKYLHLGTATTATELAREIRRALAEQKQN